MKPNGQMVYIIGVPMKKSTICKWVLVLLSRYRPETSFIFTCLMLLGVISTTLGQGAYDNNWLFGYSGSSGSAQYGGTILSFDNEGGVTIDTFEIPETILWPVSVLSDSVGSLLAYSEGCRIYNAAHQVVMGADTINSGSIWDGSCGDHFGYSGGQSVLLLPWPGKQTNKIAVLHLRPGNGYQEYDLLLSQLVRDPLSGQLKATSVDSVLMILKYADYITAAQHANGRDWWIIVPTGSDSNFIRLLLSPTGVSLIENQKIGVVRPKYFAAGQASFSANGEKYALFSPAYGLQVFDFDRCDGKLSNEIYLPLLGLEDRELEDLGGVAFSHDSRYLYVSNNTIVAQYDLDAVDLKSSMVIIGEYDSFLDPVLPSTYYQLKLAPNGQILGTSPNSGKSLHVISTPYRKGLNCGFKPHSLSLPKYRSIHVSNSPAYNTGPEIGSICDSLNLATAPIARFIVEKDPTYPFILKLVDQSLGQVRDYYWDFGDDNSSINQHTNHYYKSSGEYKVCFTVANGIGATTLCKDVLISKGGEELPELLDNLSFTIYPNPVGDYLNIMVSPFPLDAMSIVIYSVDGKLVNDYALDEVMMSTTVDLSSLPSGTFVYQILYKNHVIRSGTFVNL